MYRLSGSSAGQIKQVDKQDVNVKKEAKLQTGAESQQEWSSCFYIFIIFTAEDLWYIQIME